MGKADGEPSWEDGNVPEHEKVVVLIPKLRSEIAKTVSTTVKSHQRLGKWIKPSCMMILERMQVSNIINKSSSE